jgi:hypothetical protein
MIRAQRVLAVALACSSVFVSCAPDEAMVGRPLPAAEPEAEPVVLDAPLAIDLSLPVVDELVLPDAAVLPAEAAAASWVVAIDESSDGIAIDQESLDCATTGLVQLLGADRSVQLGVGTLTDEEIPLVGELLGICTAEDGGLGRLYADAAGLVLSESTLDCLDGAFADPLVAKAAATAALWTVERDASAIPPEVDQVAVDTVVGCLDDDELARLLG